MENNHKKRFLTLMKKGKVHLLDDERKALFWILSGQEDLFKSIDSIYDFKNGSIRAESLKKIDNASLNAMIRVAFNLYNGINNRADVFETFCYLDSINFEIVMEAIKIRFNQASIFDNSEEKKR